MDCLHQGLTKLRQSIHPARMQISQMQTPQTQTPAAIHMPDTSVPMEIDQSWPRPKMHTCYNCGEPSHLSHPCKNPQKQRIQVTILAEMDIKSIVAEAVAVAMDAREVAKKAKQAKESENMEIDFQAGQW